MTEKFRDQSRAAKKARAPAWQPRVRLPGEPEPGGPNVMSTHYDAKRDNPPVTQRKNSEQFLSIRSIGFST